MPRLCQDGRADERCLRIRNHYPQTRCRDARRTTRCPGRCSTSWFLCATRDKFRCPQPAVLGLGTPTPLAVAGGVGRFPGARTLVAARGRREGAPPPGLRARTVPRATRPATVTPGT